MSGVGTIWFGIGPPIYRWVRRLRSQSTLTASAVNCYLRWSDRWISETAAPFSTPFLHIITSRQILGYRYQKDLKKRIKIETQKSAKDSVWKKKVWHLQEALILKIRVPRP